MYWALFGMGDSDVVTLEGYQADFTERIGYVVYGAYNAAAVIVLLNMLIAMMTRSFESIQVPNVFYVVIKLGICLKYNFVLNST